MTEITITAADREWATAIRAALIRGSDGMPSYPVDIIPPIVAQIRHQARTEALQAIANLPTGRTEEVMEGHEDAYRAVERLSVAPASDRQILDVAFTFIREHCVFDSGTTDVAVCTAPSIRAWQDFAAKIGALAAMVGE